MNKIFRYLLHTEKVVSTDIKQALKKLKNDIKSLPIGNETIQNFYSSKAILPPGQSPEQLAGWFSKYHPRYNMSSWCFFGNITDDNGITAAISSIVQYQIMPNQPPYIAEWSYCDEQTKGYVLAPFILENENNVEYSSPFAITVDANPIYGGLISLTLFSGRMGEAGAKYRMTGRVITEPDLLDEWEYELEMTDTFGTIQVGYGPSSFLPQWLNKNQRDIINDKYNSDVNKYLEQSQDDMTGQGSYYFTIPLLKVEHFNIIKNGKPYFSGTKGNMWIDYVVQGFNAESLPVLGSATWQFFALQFPEIEGYYGIQAAMMISIVEVKDASGEISTLSMAHFYYDDPYHSKKNENGSRLAAFEWSMNNIQFEVIEYWENYPVKFKLTLSVPNGKSTVIYGEAINNNQVVSAVKKYEGVFNIKADIYVNDFEVTNVKGFGWAEVH
ncbi:MAG: hypothetical protein RO257_04945 [Candidatus Kapabacteria bacterium]|nr:hypothetical protein [Candidatus Kapabacteria bacterium]